MRVRVLQRFKDAHTGAIRKKGDIFEATKGRVAEIRAVNPDLIEIITEDQETPEEPETPEESKQLRKTGRKAKTE